MNTLARRLHDLDRLHRACHEIVRNNLRLKLVPKVPESLRCKDKVTHETIDRDIDVLVNFIKHPWFACVSSHPVERYTGLRNN